MKFKLCLLSEKRELEQMRKRINRNLQNAKNKNDKIMKSTSIRAWNKIHKKIMKYEFGVSFAWNWINERELIIIVTAPARDEDIIRSVKSFKNWGNITIFVLDEKTLEVIKEI